MARASPFDHAGGLPNGTCRHACVRREGGLSSSSSSLDALSSLGVPAPSRARPLSSPPTSS
eukprot:3485761-Prymnesium_polylepis.1